MRELIKSSLSSSLALSLFGAQQMLNVFRPGTREAPRTSDVLNSAAQAIVDQSGEVVRTTYHVTDRAQRSLVDLTFRLLSFGLLARPDRSSPRGGATSQAADATRGATTNAPDVVGDVTNRAVNMVGDWVRGMGGRCSCRDGNETDHRRPDPWAQGTASGREDSQHLYDPGWASDAPR
jgi:hypothetical protein